MADDIKIRVGVASTVKQDMDRLVVDMGLGAQKVQVQQVGTLEALLKRARGIDQQKKDEDILAGLKFDPKVQAAEFKRATEEWENAAGISGRKASDRFSGEFGGSRLRTSLTQALRGNFSAALESLQDQFKIFASSAAIKIAGALTAGFAGWKVGQMLDAKLGLSDKLAEIATSAQRDIDDLSRMNVKNLRGQREDAEKGRKESATISELQARLARAQRSRVAQSGGAKGILAFQQEELQALQNKLKQQGLTVPARLELKLAVEEQMGVVQKAIDAVEAEKRQAERETQSQRERAESEYADRQKERARKIEAELEQKRQVRRDILEGRVDEVEKGRDKAGDAQKIRDERRKILQDKFDKDRDAFLAASDPQAWGQQAGGERADARAEKSRDRMIAELEERQKRGTKLSKRQQEMLDKYWAAAAGKGAINQIDALDAQAKQAQVDALDQLKLLNGELAKLNGNLTLGK